MNDIDVVGKTLNYFRSTQNYFWRWAEKGQVIEWQNGSTICYRQDLLPVLESLEGLPPLGTVLLLLAACRDNWKETSGGDGILLKILNYYHTDDGDWELNEWEAKNLEKITYGTLRFMDMVGSLPRRYRTGMQRIQLVQIVSECISQKIPKEDAKILVDEFNSGRMDEVVFTESLAVILPIFWQDVENLDEALKHFPTKESLEIRIRTGIGHLPGVLETEIPGQPPPDLMQLLAEDHKTAGIARLARHLVAALHIPMQTSGSSDQPFGGVSDITNRGNFDRLLLSELAHDELTLMARLANNEALFMRREELPSHLSRERVILLDTTLKMWGVPRVFALSAALACAQNNKANVAISAYALSGNGFENIDLFTPQGIVHALELMDPALHCEKALTSFLHGRPKTGRTEYFLITGHQGLQGTAWEAGFYQLKQSTGYLITVDREGGLRFNDLALGRREGGRRLLATARFDLEELLFAPAHSTQKKVYLENAPAFMNQDPCPLYFPASKVSVTLQNTFHTNDLHSKEQHVVSVTLDQRVLYWSSRERGAKEIIPFIEEGRYSFGFDGREVIFMMVYKTSGYFLQLFHINIYNQEVKRFDIPEKIKEPEEVLFQSNEFFIRTRNEVFTVHAADAGLIEKKNPESMHEKLYGIRSKLTLFDTGRIRRFVNNGYSVLNHVKEMYVDKFGCLCLDKRWLSLYQVAIGHYVIRLRNIEGSEEKKKVPVSDELVTIKGFPNVHTKFHRFAWANGSEVLVDSRGLLHLRSADKRIPEITLVLVLEKPLACWASDGHAHGSAYFTGSTESLDAHLFYRNYLQRFIEAL